MKLSPHFDLKEFACKDGSLPPDESLDLLKRLCVEILEPVRERWGAMRVTSGYRSPDYNIKIGGSATSDHVYSAEGGVAADIQILDANVSLETAFYWAALDVVLPFDQCFLEYRPNTDPKQWACIHFGFRPNARRQAGIKPTGGGGKIVWVQAKEAE